jgi:hypothetical protein
MGGNCRKILEGRKLLAQESAERVEKEPFGAFPFWWTTETHLTKYRSNEARKYRSNEARKYRSNEATKQRGPRGIRGLRVCVKTGECGPQRLGTRVHPKHL